MEYEYVDASGDPTEEGSAGARRVPCLSALLEDLQEGDFPSEADFTSVVDAAAQLLDAEPNCVRVESPLNVMGDLHGQLFDLLKLLGESGLLGLMVSRGPPPPRGGGAPAAPSARWGLLFMGDYVDRGLWGCEVVLVLMALKLRWPQRVVLLRGNHESRTMARCFNFESEVLEKYSAAAFERAMACFDRLPLAAVVDGKFFCAHAGISPEMKTLADLDAIERRREPPPSGLMCDVLWSDPIHGAPSLEKFDLVEMPPPPVEAASGNVEDDLEGMIATRFGDAGGGAPVRGRRASAETVSASDAPAAPRRFHSIAAIRVDTVSPWQANTKRGCSHFYGVGPLRDFLRCNGLSCVMRAHEVMEDGIQLGLAEASPGGKYPGVMTVFSAPNYCGNYGNQAAFVRIRPNGVMEVKQFSAAEMPEHAVRYMAQRKSAIKGKSEKEEEKLEQAAALAMSAGSGTSSSKAKRPAQKPAKKASGGSPFDEPPPSGPFSELPAGFEPPPSNAFSEQPPGDAFSEQPPGEFFSEVPAGFEPPPGDAFREQSPGDAFSEPPPSGPFSELPAGFEPPSSDAFWEQPPGGFFSEVPAGFEPAPSDAFSEQPPDDGPRRKTSNVVDVSKLPADFAGFDDTDSD